VQCTIVTIATGDGVEGSVYRTLAAGTDMEQIHFRSRELNVSAKDIHLGLEEFLTPDFPTPFPSRNFHL
jgi:hypothetical protein